MMSSDTESLRRYLNGFAATMAAAIVAATTGLYVVTAYKYETDHVEMESTLLAEQISWMIYAAPNSWKFQHTRLREFLYTFEKRPGAALYEPFIEIVDTDGSVILEVGNSISFPSLSFTSDLSDGFRVVGRIRLTSTTRHIWERAVWALLASLLLGVFIFVVMRVLPMRALIRRETALETAHEAASASKQRVSAAHARLMDAIEAMPDGFILYDSDDRVVLFNSHYAELYDGQADLLVPGTKYEELRRSEGVSGTVVDAVGRVDDWLRDRLDKHRNWQKPFEVERAGQRWLLILMRPTEDGGIVAIRRDITDRKKAEENLKLAATVFDHTNEALLVTDVEGRITSINPAFTQITGYTAADVLGKDPKILKSGKHPPEFFQAMWESLSETRNWTGEIWNQRKNGELYPQWTTINVLTNDDDEITGYAAIFSDISERKEYEEKICYQANYDSLTNLPNRLLFRERLAQTVLFTRRKGEHQAVLFVDLDNFKMINDSLGHDAGDALLQQAAERFQNDVRETDTVARMGGDEFTILLSHITDPEDAAFIARKLLSTVAVPFVLRGHNVTVTASIGIAVCPHDAVEPGELITYADAAMYQAKSRGKNNYQFFTEDLKGKAIDRLNLETGLRDALDNEDFELHYQPCADLATGTVVSVEALVRWRRDGGELLPPSEFIPAAEETGLIIALGQWVLHQACAQNKAWQDAGLPPVRVAVNISARQFARPEFVPDIERVLDETGLAPEYLELELTETILMDQARSAITSLRDLHALGIKLSIDDFGTGYSSLSYLKYFPIDTLKIDKSFVRDIISNPDDLTIVNTIISMAHQMDMKAVAEGVETEGQLALLRTQDLDEIQGFLLSKPMPADRMMKFLRKVAVTLEAD
jgi:diguanylate cyclase (GGDEF)-like protein/PAS domain S-box-containing protein